MRKVRAQYKGNPHPARQTSSRNRHDNRCETRPYRNRLPLRFLHVTSPYHPSLKVAAASSVAPTNVSFYSTLRAGISRPGFDRDQNAKRRFCDHAQLADKFREANNVRFTLESGHRNRPAYYLRRISSGSLAIFAAIRCASSDVVAIDDGFTEWPFRLRHRSS